MRFRNLLELETDGSCVAKTSRTPISRTLVFFAVFARFHRNPWLLLGLSGSDCRGQTGIQKRSGVAEKVLRRIFFRMSCSKHTYEYQAYRANPNSTRIFYSQLENASCSSCNSCYCSLVLTSCCLIYPDLAQKLDTGTILDIVLRSDASIRCKYYR